MFKEHENCLSEMTTMLFWMKTVLKERKPCINNESKSDELTINLYSCHDINMNSLIVVIPPSIFRGCSTRKTFWEEKFTVKDIFFCLCTWNIVVIAKLGKKRRLGVVTRFSPGTSQRSLTVWKRRKPHLQSQKKVGKIKKGVRNRFGFQEQSKVTKIKRQGMPS